MNNPIRSAARRLRLPVALALVSLSGCTGYRLGSTLPPDLKTIYVPTFANVTGQPRVEFQVTSETIRELQRQGTLKVTGESQADLILEAKLTKYELIPLQYRRDQALTAREYRLQLEAEVVLKRAGTGKVLVKDAAVAGWSTFLSQGGDLKAAERSALPAAARDLGNHIVEAVVEYW